tara:strand:- start:627 stop:995 length:369 start_codon:yes stop_codon:yes gene_type:complete
MIDTDKYEGHTEGPWELSPDDWVWAEHLFMQGNTTNYGNAMLITDAPLLLEEVKRLRKKNDLLRSMQRDGIEASAHDRLLLEINRLREDNEKLHDAINRSFHAKISGSALEIYNGWWEGEEE